MRRKTFGCEPQNAAVVTRHIKTIFTRPHRTFTFGALLLFPLSFIACPGANAPSARNNAASDSTRATSLSSTPATSINNAASPPPTGAPAFDADRAFAHVRRMVEIGPRPAGSKELARTREFVISELKSYEGLNVSTDEFDARTPIGNRRMVNITAELPGESPDAIIIASHYDTKLFRNMRFVGANDGGSSTGALIELARVLALKAKQAGKPRFTYRFLFLDGEEAVCEGWDDCKAPDGSPDNTYGSRHYVNELTKRGEQRSVRALVLLDMIGARDAKFERDTNGTAWMINAIWETARALGHGNVFVGSIDPVEDDHIPFLRAGIESVDIIHLSTYPYWHTAEDTLDKLSPQTLKVVGDVVLASLPRIEEHLLSRAPDAPVKSK